MHPHRFLWSSLAGICLFLLAGCVTVKVNLFEEQKPLQEKVVSGRGRDKILLLDFSGMIMEGQKRKWWSPAAGVSPARIKEELEKAAKDPRIKALVLRINSPGGTVSASDMIYHDLMAFKSRQKVPVVACLMGVAASGGYYVARTADLIVAHPTTITGSIGVIAMKPNFKGLMDKLGVEADLVKTGRWKDFWSPFRPASPEEKEMMQAIIDDFSGAFRRWWYRGASCPGRGPEALGRTHFHRRPGPSGGAGGPGGLPGRRHQTGPGPGRAHRSPGGGLPPARRLPAHHLLPPAGTGRRLGPSVPLPLVAGGGALGEVQGWARGEPGS